MLAIGLWIGLFLAGVGGVLAAIFRNPVGKSEVDILGCSALLAIVGTLVALVSVAVRFIVRALS